MINYLLTQIINPKGSVVIVVKIVMLVHYIEALSLDGTLELTFLFLLD